ncbi:hypothetical protein K493DRAFT_317346 [Basidiobolus meristosporus CBS 931.73]|uniref:RGS domain-containing protein n=1 Tax=Basidiobolus meristosporus CBS 931.73 TaxID=1314790 RepID=A0A1Y1Y0B1_9FUNG|nr:hypothetical protein K493DRAFT_317346 [Basidiobolus meristosporus CBS 931.73]|eukprot:ORX91335.1 hypothetical protein K493DRAFT_317346 [Basidiobolus meristosporus CBS 931.73]
MNTSLLLTCIITPLWTLQCLGCSIMFWRHRNTDYIKYRSPKLSLLVELFVCIFGVLYMLRWSLTGLIPCFVIVWITEFGYPVIYLAIIARSVRLLFLYRLSEAKLVAASTYDEHEAAKRYRKRRSEVTHHLKKRSSDDSGLEMRNLTSPSTPSTVHNDSYPSVPLEHSWFHKHRYILSPNYLNTVIGIILTFHAMILIVLQVFSPKVAILPTVAMENCFVGWEWIPHQMFIVLYNLILFILVILLRDVADAYGIRAELLYMSIVNMIFDIFFIMFFHIPVFRELDPHDYVVNLMFVPLLNFHYHMIIRPVLASRGYPSMSNMLLRQNRNSAEFGFHAHSLTASKLSFDQMVESYALWEQFKLFAVQDFTVENVLFFERCRKLKQMWAAENATPPETSTLEKEIHDLYNTFIAPNARFVVNLNGKTRRLIQEALKKREYKMEIFERALEEVGELMFRNTYPRFLQSRRNLHLKWEDVGAV